MIIWDEKDIWGPNAKDRCVLCRGRLRPPLIVWHPSRRGDDNDYDGYERFFCSECCADICHGFPIDLKQISTAKEVERLGFRHAARRAAVSGGFLYTTKGNKQ